MTYQSVHCITFESGKDILPNAYVDETFLDDVATTEMSPLNLETSTMFEACQKMMISIMTMKNDFHCRMKN